LQMHTVKRNGQISRKAPNLEFSDSATENST
jgi:hypothetical protein